MCVAYNLHQSEDGWGYGATIFQDSHEMVVIARTVIGFLIIWCVLRGFALMVRSGSGVRPLAIHMKLWASVQDWESRFCDGHV